MAGISSFITGRQTRPQLGMNVLIVGQVDLAAEPVNAIPGIQMFIIAVLVTHMGVNEENTGKGQGESKDAQDRIGGLSDQVFKCDGDVGTYHGMAVSVLDYKISLQLLHQELDDPMGIAGIFLGMGNHHHSCSLAVVFVSRSRISGSVF